MERQRKIRVNKEQQRHYTRCGEGNTGRGNASCWEVKARTKTECTGCRERGENSTPSSG